MKKFCVASLLLLIVQLVVIQSPLCAQTAGDREEWLSEMRQYKRSYFAKELNLTREQQNKFFPLYEELQTRTDKLNADARTMEKRVAEAGDASDLEYEKATEAIYDAKVEEANLEKEYLGKFKEILSKKQLFRLKSVERNFSREMMRQHSRLRSARRAENK